ncbi:MAG TPA: hypothetical protein VG409_09575, partial [Actinomycetota bacterium]|nr:hypothetical protein [Actinomycetota bacterium]
RRRAAGSERSWRASGAPGGGTGDRSFEYHPGTAAIPPCRGAQSPHERVLDEPTAALDARAEHELFESIRTMCRGRSVLLISHRFSSVRSADRIYVLDGGRVVESGSHDQLMGLGGRYADLFALQASAYLSSEPS